MTEHAEQNRTNVLVCPPEQTEQIRTPPLGGGVRFVRSSCSRAEHDPAGFRTQLAYHLDETGKIERRTDSTAIAAPLTVITAQALHPLTTARLLRRLADELEAGR